MLSSELGDKDTLEMVIDEVLVFTAVFSLKNVRPILFN